MSGFQYLLMGNNNMGLSIQKCVKLFVGKGGSVLRPKVQKFYGINPVLTYPKTGKSFELPRFCTEEMKTALNMNKNVIRQVKKPLVRNYSAATPEDLKRLTSTSIEDSFSRVEWVNPKDGKVYNILKQGETNSGNVSVRILDENGGFIKDAELTPKVIGIPDNYSDVVSSLGLSHGVMVTTFARRNNPFAKYVPFSITRNEIVDFKELDNVFEYIKKGGKLDYLSCSYGTDVFSKKKLPAEYSKFFADKQIYDRLSSRHGTRILSAANNATPESLSQVNSISNNILVINSKVEGVGALSPQTGKISNFSLSRNSNLTQHYELGEFQPTLTKDGINLTGLPGTDIGFLSKKMQDVATNPLIGKSCDKVKHLLDVINGRLRDIQKETFGLFSSKRPLPEIMKEKALLEKQKMLYTQRSRRIFDYMSQLRVEDGKYQVPMDKITGTSVSTPIRVAKLALNDMMEGVI